MAPSSGSRRPPIGGVFAGFAAAVPALLFAGCAPLAPAGVGGPAPPGAAALAARLPATAAGFGRGEARPAGAGGTGREVAYATAGGRLTAAASVELLADDTPAAAALDALLAEVLRPAAPRELREAGRFAAAGGGPEPLLCARTEGRYGRERVAGLACAGRVGGALLRIKVTMPAREPPPADPRAFAEAVAAALSGPAPAG